MKKKNLKLSFNKETITKLQNYEMNDVKGGTKYPPITIAASVPNYCCLWTVHNCDPTDACTNVATVAECCQV